MNAQTSDSIGHGGLRPWLKLSRPFTLVVPAVGVAAGALSGATFSGSGYDGGLWLAILLAGLAAALLNAASNAINQVTDLKIDALVKPARPIPSGQISLPAAKWFAIAAYAIAIGFAAWLGATRNWWTLVIFGVAALATVLYSVPPFRTRRFPVLANVTIAIPRGFLLPVAGWSLSAEVFSLPALLIGIFPGLYLLGAASTKDFADIEGDRADGVVTLPILLGVRRAVWVVSISLIVPFVAMAAVHTAGVEGMPSVGLSLLALFLALWGAWVARMLLRDPEALASSENHPSWGHMYLMMLAYNLGTAACFLLSAGA